MAGPVRYLEANRDMMLQILRRATKKQFSDVHIPLSAKSLLRNPINHPFPIPLRSRDHKPPMENLPYLSPRIVTIEGQIQPPGMEADPRGHVSQNPASLCANTIVASSSSEEHGAPDCCCIPKGFHAQDACSYPASLYYFGYTGNTRSYKECNINS